MCNTIVCMCNTIVCMCNTIVCMYRYYRTYMQYVCMLCIIYCIIIRTRTHTNTHTTRTPRAHTQRYTHNDTHTHTTTTTTTTAAAARTRVHIHAHANVHKHTPCLARSSTKASLWGSTYHMHTYHMHTGLHKQSHLTQTFATADPSQRDTRHHACDKVLNAYSFPHARPIEQRRAQDEANKRIEYGTQQPT